MPLFMSKGPEAKKKTAAKPFPPKKKGKGKPAKARRQEMAMKFAMPHEMSEEVSPARQALKLRRGKKRKKPKETSDAPSE